MATYNKHRLFPRDIFGQVADLVSKRTYLQENAARFGISSADMAKVSGQVDAVLAVHARASDHRTRTRIDVATRRAAIRTAEDTIRKVLKYYVDGNPATTPVDTEMLNMARTGPHTLLQPPTHIPGIGRIHSHDLTVIIPFFDALTGRHGKPEGVQSFEIAIKLGGEMPVKISELTGSALATDSPARLPFDFENEGQFLYLAFRWRGTRGDLGPWSEIYKIRISR
jgi:hypothetical protein